MEGDKNLFDLGYGMVHDFDFELVFGVTLSDHMGVLIDSVTVSRLLLPVFVKIEKNSPSGGADRKEKDLLAVHSGHFGPTRLNHKYKLWN